MQNLAWELIGWYGSVGVSFDLANRFNFDNIFRDRGTLGTYEASICLRSKDGSRKKSNISSKSLVLPSAGMFI